MSWVHVSVVSRGASQGLFEPRLAEGCLRLRGRADPPRNSPSSEVGLSYPRYIEISMTQALDHCHGSTSKDSTLADVGKSLNAWVLVVFPARWIWSPSSGSTAYPLIGPSQVHSSAFGTARAASDYLGACISSFCRWNSHPASLAFQPLHLGLPTAKRGLQRCPPLSMAQSTPQQAHEPSPPCSPSGSCALHRSCHACSI